MFSRQNVVDYKKLQALFSRAPVAVRDEKSPVAASALPIGHEYVGKSGPTAYGGYSGQERPLSVNEPVRPSGRVVKRRDLSLATKKGCCTFL